MAQSVLNNFYNYRVHFLCKACLERLSISQSLSKQCSDDMARLIAALLLVSNGVLSLILLIFTYTSISLPGSLEQIQ